MTSWDSVLIAPELPLQAAISVLDRGGLQIAVVVDEQRRILGTVTDGDVRRALIRQIGLDAPISEVMAKQPRTAPAGSAKERVLQLMERHQISQIPMVDADNRVVGIETLHGLLHGKRRDNAVFLMAGGFGTRLQPLTDNCPKPLLNVGDKPILEIIIENFVRAGFYRFFISTHYLPEMIRDHIGDGSRWGIDVQYVHEDEPLGTGGALGLLPRDAIREPMFMMNGDLLTNLDFNKLLDFHDSHDGVATMCVREHEHRVPYGVIQGDGQRIISMVEKPAYRYFINAGIYVLSPSVLAGVTRGHRIDMPTLLQQQMAQGLPVNMFPVHEYWLDIGRMEDFQRAQYDVAGLFHG
ncbi:nucleotidyltransferase family protein [Roseateles amylovorans]|uniref:Nucleotidyltransferase family protein n=1 Tax=Roseateles amylovorans TaxID=2978473 RepID=A0ABY6B282_9BURK|nr:nucleotidyltransferase family protein [Roseateles amylovorans]UXH77628.1 nucleotidyltransferase family protein [Roseateles amylovorans]